MDMMRQFLAAVLTTVGFVAVEGDVQAYVLEMGTGLIIR